MRSKDSKKENLTAQNKKKRTKSSSEGEPQSNESFAQFIVLESFEETTITKLSPILIEKTISLKLTPTDVKKKLLGQIVEL